MLHFIHLYLSEMERSLCQQVANQVNFFALKSHISQTFRKGNVEEVKSSYEKSNCQRKIEQFVPKLMKYVQDVKTVHWRVQKLKFELSKSKVRRSKHLCIYANNNEAVTIIRFILFSPTFVRIYSVLVITIVVNG